MSLQRSLLAVVSAVPLLVGSSAWAQAEKKSPKELISFGTLRVVNADEARSQALTWLKGVGKTDDATLKSFEEIWSAARPVADRVAQTLALGDADAAVVELRAEAL